MKLAITQTWTRTVEVELSPEDGRLLSEDNSRGVAFQERLGQLIAFAESMMPDTPMDQIGTSGFVIMDDETEIELFDHSRFL